VFSLCAPHSETSYEEKESFWDDVFMKVGIVPQDEMVVVAVDVNGHVGSNNLGYNGIHGGFRCECRNSGRIKYVGLCRRVKFSHLQHTVYEARSKFSVVHLAL